MPGATLPERTATPEPRNALPVPKRIRRHLWLGLAALFLVTGLFFLAGFSTETWVDVPELKAESFQWRLSIALAYSALVYLAVTLAIGPLTVLRNRLNPVNHMLRRDIAIWAGSLAIAHVSVSVFIHTEGWQLWGLFFWHLPDSHNWLPIRQDLFGIANFLGLAQLSILVLLLTLSNNFALRKLGTRKWKALQRLSYAAFASISLHGLFYQGVERRDPAIRVAFIAIISGVFLLQAAGALKRLSRVPARQIEPEAEKTSL